VPGLTIALFGCGLSLVESAIAVGICLRNTPFLTWRPPRVGTVNAALPIAAATLSFAVLAVVVGAGGRAVVALALLPFGVVAIKALTRRHRRFRPSWLPRRQQGP
jgi:hypothetical protein